MCIRDSSESGVIVTLILLARATGDPEADRVLLHPSYDPRAPNRLGAFNTVTPEGRRWLAAAARHLGARYGREDRAHGRVWNYVVGNEVNSHWFWYNRGRASLEEVAADYLEAVRLVHGAARAGLAHARVYVSLEHHWSIRYPGGDERQTFPGRPFLQEFARRAREGGDFDWHVAFHPYPENLFECRFWLDRTATPEPDSPRVTFKNLEVLAEFLARDELRFGGVPRRVILSEQGFHAADREGGERDQAAAFAAAWQAVSERPGIDAFVLHRHVDHAHEGGLRLGLWRRREGSVCEPESRRPIYELFRACDTESWAETSAFALPVLGIERWEDWRSAFP